MKNMFSTHQSEASTLPTARLADMKYHDNPAAIRHIEGELPPWRGYMDNDRHYLSFGGGVNSTAMLLLLLDSKEYDFEAVFVDTGCEYPETYEYVEMINRDVYPITILDSAVYNYGRNLLQECQKYRMVPSMRQRWCTSSWKIGPLYKHFETPCFVDIGIALEESHRQRLSGVDGMENCYPLIEHRIDRQGCVRIIESHGLPVPRKSGCFICPMQTMKQVRDLKEDHPELFYQLKQLEDASIERQREKSRPVIGYWHASNKPLDVIVNANQETLFPEHHKPCECAY